MLNVFFYFFTRHFLLKNKSSLISVNRTCSFQKALQLLQMDNNHQKLVGVSQQRLGWLLRRVQLTAGPPPHLPWRPVNLKMRLQRQFHLPPALFTCLMKNLCVPEIIAVEFLHKCQNFRGICKSIKNDIFGLENNLYLDYSHKGVIVRVEETISKLQNWHTCKNFRGTLPCNLSKCAVFHT